MTDERQIEMPDLTEYLFERIGNVQQNNDMIRIRQVAEYLAVLIQEYSREHGDMIILNQTNGIPDGQVAVKLGLDKV
jgi:hypothetical protein